MRNDHPAEVYRNSDIFRRLRDYKDLSSVEALFEKFGREIAAVIIEPVTWG